jgi:hypothetical protein
MTGQAPLRPTAARAAGQETTMGGSTTVWIHAPPERVYGLVADVTRMGEWSPECYACEWLDGADHAAAGTRFLGHNRMRFYTWTTTAVVEQAVPGEVFSFVAGGDTEGKTRWTYRFARAGSGTAATESWETLVPAPVWIRVVERILLLGRSREANLREATRHTLERLKAAAET